MLTQFKFKDTFTAANLFLSFYAVIIMFEGRFELACYLMLFNIFILDIMDGLWARITKTGNRFGKEFDSMVDFVGSSIMISFFVYVALKDTNMYLALLAGFGVVFVGVLREVRSSMVPVAHKGYFIGLPRNVGLVTVLIFMNCSVYHYAPWSLAPFILVILILQLTHIPFIGNDKDVMFKVIPRLKVYLPIAGLLVIAASFVGMFWDMMMLMMFCCLISPIFLTNKGVRQDIREQVLRAKA